VIRLLTASVLTPRVEALRPFPPGYEVRFLLDSSGKMTEQILRIGEPRLLRAVGARSAPPGQRMGERPSPAPSRRARRAADAPSRSSRGMKTGAVKKDGPFTPLFPFADLSMLR
jgi:hypothetical protein